MKALPSFFARPLALLAAPALLLFQPLAAQELSLFEQPVREAVQQAIPMGPEQPFANGNGQPAYTLRGISRFGNQYHATLINRAGEVAKVSWNAGETPRVANSGFTIVAAGPATLSLAHPPGDSCISADLAGVSCSDGNRSELRLTVAMPLASNGVAPMPAAMGPNQQNPNFIRDSATGAPVNPFEAAAIQQRVDQPQQNGQQVFINPFSGEPEVMPQVSPEELAARQQRQELRAQRLQQFEQPRVNDADVPPGMQRVRTPFGDRLMPIRE